MTTIDFSSLSNFGADPLRATQLAIASTIDLDDIGVNTFGGPGGRSGFRSGTWTATYHGATYRFFDSIPHSCELDEQTRRLKTTAALHIAGKTCGYIK